MLFVLSIRIPPLPREVMGTDSKSDVSVYVGGELYLTKLIRSKTGLLKVHSLRAL